jgi:SpoVK/Ycf46/Vps4 family AAA+-type ATPase
LGVPEASLRYAIKVAESCAPCVLWVDEIEGGIANTGAKGRGGPASRVISYFLTWMQEKQSPVFVGATANEIELVPPEFIRKGRFDEIFYVTLPNLQEREQIFEIHLHRRGIDPGKINLQNLAKSTEGYNGAEIEQIVISAQFEAFQQKRPVNEHDVFVSVGRIVPLSTTMKEDIKRLERWAFNRTVKASK